MADSSLGVAAHAGPEWSLGMSAANSSAVPLCTSHESRTHLQTEVMYSIDLGTLGFDVVPQFYVVGHPVRCINPGLRYLGEQLSGRATVECKPLYPPWAPNGTLANTEDHCCNRGTKMRHQNVALGRCNTRLIVVPGCLNGTCTGADWRPQSATWDL